MIAKVLVEVASRNVDREFSYNIPDNLRAVIKVGIRVKVPFGKRILEGFVLEIVEDIPEDLELKDIIEEIDKDIILTEELLELGKYVKEKTLATLISCYQAMLPKALKAKEGTLINKKYITYIELNKDISDDFKGRQLEIIEALKEGRRLKSDLNQISISAVKTLLTKNVIKEIREEEYRLNDIYEKHPKFELNSQQKEAVESILNYDGISLLHGVTGSGKTEVYMEIIEETIKKGKTAIVLVPEISLTPQIVGRFTSRFANMIAVLHSALSEGEKYDEYRKIARGEVNIVIGARSAIFAPLSNIGVIIIDEEHSQTYKQDSNPKYNALDVAIERSKRHDAKVVLGSATPSLESYSRAVVKKYNLVTMDKRVNDQSLPEIVIIDMNEEKKKSNIFSTQLTEAIKETLNKNEQIILLLNRRGYASFVTCSNCGFVSKCPNCDITLTYHKTSDLERCHYCGFATKRKDICPECHEKAIRNLGIGTEKVEEEIKKLFNISVVRMDLDTTSFKGAHQKIIEDFKNKRYNILLGTQMISKGLDFSNVTLVGVINADTSLLIPNFRSSEYTFQLLMQVSGRSGRGDKKGKVIIQTFNKDHYAIEAVKTHDYHRFFNQEMKIRRDLSYPPYYYVASLKVISSSYDVAQKESNFVAKNLRENLADVTVLGPSIGSVFKYRNTYRFSIMLKYKKSENLYKYLKKLLEHYQNKHNVTLDIDFDSLKF